MAQLLPCTKGFEQQHSADGLLRLKDPFVLGILSGEVFICIAVGTYQSAGAYQVYPCVCGSGVSAAVYISPAIRKLSVDGCRQHVSPQSRIAKYAGTPQAMIHNPIPWLGLRLKDIQLGLGAHLCAELHPRELGTWNKTSHILRERNTCLPIEAEQAIIW